MWILFFRCLFAGMSSCSITADAAKSLFCFFVGWFLTAVLYFNRLQCFSFPALSHLLFFSFSFSNRFRYLKLKKKKKKKRGENQTRIRSQTGGIHQVGMDNGEVYTLKRVWGKKLTWSADTMRGLGFHCFRTLGSWPNHEKTPSTHAGICVLAGVKNT